MLGGDAAARAPGAAEAPLRWHVGASAICYWGRGGVADGGKVLKAAVLKRARI